MDLCYLVYETSEKFPKSEIYGLTTQIRRCSVSIPSNIAEGQNRGSSKEFKQFLRIAYGSGAELETQLLIARKIGYIKSEDLNELLKRLVEVMKMLNVFIQKLN